MIVNTLIITALLCSLIFVVSFRIGNRLNAGSSFARESSRLFAQQQRRPSAKQRPGPAKKFNTKTSRTPLSSKLKDQSKKAEPKQEEKPAPAPKAKNFAMKTILGQSIIKCREFSIDAKRDFEFIGSYTNIDQIPIYPLPEIAFVGRSNVGKSSLLNCISGASKNIAVESKVPGRTQCINLFKCKDSDGDICIFTDLPGYGFAKLSKEQQKDISTFVNQYLHERESLKLTVVIVDARREEQSSDMEMLEFLSEAGNPFAVIATKADKLKKAELETIPPQLQRSFDLPEGQPVLFSAETGLGKREVWRLVKDAILDRGVFSDENYEIIDGDGDGDEYEEYEEEE